MAELQRPTIFKWWHFAPEVILCTVRWYLRYSLSYRDVQELLIERGLDVAPTTIWRWVQRYAPELNERTRPHLKRPTSPGGWMRLMCGSKAVGSACVARSIPQELRSTFSCRRFVPPMRPKRSLPEALADASHPQPRVISRVRAKQHFRQFGCARRTIQG
jgi:hypothetical protein